MSWRRGQAYGQDLRERVLQATSRLSEVARRFGVSPSYVLRVRARREQLGQTRAGVQRNHVPLRLGTLRQEVLAQVASAPEQTLAQLCEWAYATPGIVVKPSTMHKSLRRFGLTLKKKTIYASEQQRPDVVQARTCWHDGQTSMAGHRLIFLDETSATTCMTPTRGRAPQGQRCPGFTPGGHWREPPRWSAPWPPRGCWRKVACRYFLHYLIFRITSFHKLLIYNNFVDVAQFLLMFVKPKLQGAATLVHQYRMSTESGIK